MEKKFYSQEFFQFKDFWKSTKSQIQVDSNNLLIIPPQFRGKEGKFVYTRLPALPQAAKNSETPEDLSFNRRLKYRYQVATLGLIYPFLREACERVEFRLNYIDFVTAEAKMKNKAGPPKDAYRVVAQGFLQSATDLHPEVGFVVQHIDIYWVFNNDGSYASSDSGSDSET